MQTNELRERLASAFQRDVRPGRIKGGRHGGIIDATLAYELADIALGVLRPRSAAAVKAAETIAEVERRLGGKLSPEGKAVWEGVIEDIIVEHERSSKVGVEDPPGEPYDASTDECPECGAVPHDPCLYAKAILTGCPGAGVVDCPRYP